MTSPTRVLGLRAATPRPTVAQTLRLRDDARVWQLERLRLLDGAPRVIEEALIPQLLAPELGARRGELTGSLYELLGPRVRARGPPRGAVPRGHDGGLGESAACSSSRHAPRWCACAA